MRKRKLKNRESMWGYCFIIPWVVGLLCFFIIPFIQTIFYSFNTLSISGSAGFATKFEGLRHYRFMLFQDTEFLKSLGESIMDLFYTVPLTLFYSVFAAVLLNSSFRGRTFFRSVFFLPVIVTSGVVMSLLSTDVNASQMLNGQLNDSSAALLEVTVIRDLLEGFGMGFNLSNQITRVVSEIINVGWSSGVQILLILAGLQSVPSQLYEVARIEGASKWEEFWKVTFPIALPVIFISGIYSVLDSFTAFDNPMIETITSNAFSNFNYSYAGTMALTYSLVILVLIGGVYAIIGRKVTYVEK